VLKVHILGIWNNPCLRLCVRVSQRSAVWRVWRSL